MNAITKEALKKDEGQCIVEDLQIRMMEQDLKWEQFFPTRIHYFCWDDKSAYYIMFLHWKDKNSYIEVIITEIDVQGVSKWNFTEHGYPCTATEVWCNPDLEDLRIARNGGKELARLVDPRPEFGEVPRTV